MYLSSKVCHATIAIDVLDGGVQLMGGVVIGADFLGQVFESGVQFLIALIVTE